MCHLFASIPPDDIGSETRSVRMGGQVTSIRLEAAFWQTLEALAAGQGLTLSKFLTTLHDEVMDMRGEVKNFASLLRCACLVHLKQAAPMGRPADRREPRERTLIEMMRIAS